MRNVVLFVFQGVFFWVFLAFQNETNGDAVNAKRLFTRSRRSVISLLGLYEVLKNVTPVLKAPCRYFLPVQESICCALNVASSKSSLSHKNASLSHITVLEIISD